MRPSRDSPLARMISVNSRCWVSSGVSSRSEVMPMTPFIGVRISWLIMARNWLLAALACSAARRARSCSVMSARAPNQTRAPSGSRRTEERALSQRVWLSASRTAKRRVQGCSLSMAWRREARRARRSARGTEAKRRRGRRISSSTGRPKRISKPGLSRRTSRRSSAESSKWKSAPGAWWVRARRRSLLCWSLCSASLRAVMSLSMAMKPVSAPASSRRGWTSTSFQ